jgi:hypothetical protein
MYTVERRSGPIPSVKISPDLIAELASLIYETSTKILKTPLLSVQIVEPKRIRTYSSQDEIRSIKLPTRINGIGISVDDQYGDPEAEFSARIDFGFLEPLESKYELYGPDEKDMNGLETTLKERWNQNKTWNHLVHKRPSQSIILTLSVLGVLAGIARILTRLGWLRFQPGIVSDFVVFAFLGLMVFGLLWAPLKKFIRWMFPYFSYPQDASSRARGWIRWGVGIAVTILLSSDLLTWAIFG